MNICSSKTFVAEPRKERKASNNYSLPSIAPKSFPQSDQKCDEVKLIGPSHWTMSFFSVFFEIISWEIKKNQLPWNINNMHFLKLRAKRPENRQSQKEISSSNHRFSGAFTCCCCFREGFWVVAILERIPSFLSYFFISSTTPLGFRVPAFRIRTQRNVNMASWDLPIFNGGHVSLLQGGPKKKSLQWKFSRGPGHNYELISGWNIPSYALIGRFVFIAGDRSLNTPCSVVQPEDDSMS